MLDSLTDMGVFQQASGSYRCHSERCPKCCAMGKLSPYGDYSRWLVFLKDGHAVDAQLVRPLRFQCASCGATHALLPDVIVPYSPYSLRFKLTALVAYFGRDTTVAAVCGQFGIAVSTLYAWKALFLSHMGLMLGVLAAKKEPAHGFLRSLLRAHGLSARLSGFYDRHGFSFLQNMPAPATQTHSP